jgi:REP element-mobilizing transposase RayT
VAEDKGYKIRNREGVYFLTFAVVEWVDVFSRKEYADIVIESLRYCQKEKGLVLHAWCLMTNHLHLIASSKDGANLSDILRDFKKFTSSQIIRAIEANEHESRKRWMLWIFRSAGAANGKNKTYQFWRQNNQPKELESNHFTDEKVDYLHANPVHAGLVSHPEAWCYSSAMDYAGEKGLLDVEIL